MPRPHPADGAALTGGAGPTDPAPALTPLPLGAVRARGWLLEQLKLQANGLTGHLEALWADVGPNSAWLGGAGEDWERGPYYLDGLVPLAHLLGDACLLAKAERWVEALIVSQRPDGQFGPVTNDDWWPRMVALKALSQHHEATGDARILTLMTRFFRYQLASLAARPLADWAHFRGAEGILGVVWLFERTGERFLLDLIGCLAEQTFPWGTFLGGALPPQKTTSFHQQVHAVNVAMGLKAPALLGLMGLSQTHRRQIDQALALLEAHHSQLHGMFSGDEFLAGAAPEQGTELCAVVEYMFTLQQLVQVYGDGTFGDRLERVAFNALPAALSPDLRAHQYHQQVNQVRCSVAPRAWTFATDDANLFGLEPNFGCCTANLHQGWPKFTAGLWMTAPGGGLAAVAYAPCRVDATLGGQKARLLVDTAYPFEERVRITLTLAEPAYAPLLLRKPGWCPTPQLHINGQAVTAPETPSGFLRLERVWSDGDALELVLPMTPQVMRRPSGGCGVTLGPLTLALWPGEIWERLPDSPAFGDWEVRPRRTWSYGLDLEPEEAATLDVERFEVGPQPFSARLAGPPFGVADVPLRVQVPVRRLPHWGLERNSAAPLPKVAVSTAAPRELASLIPYGCTRLRIAEFPRAVPQDV